MNKLNYIFLALLILFYGCSTFEESVTKAIEKGLKDLYAKFEGDTRTYVENNKHLRWHEDDRLTIFYGNTLNRQYKFNGAADDNSGSFSFVPSEELGANNAFNKIYALYPYNPDVSITEEGVITLTLPAEQTYAENSFGRGANTMLAVTQNLEDISLAFKNACGYLKLKLYNSKGVTIKSIEVKGNNDEKIAGTATATIVFGEVPKLTLSDDASTSVTLNCGEGITLGTTADTATEFWIVLPVTTFAKGLTITVTATEGKIFEKSTSNEVVIERNVIQPMAALEVNPEVPKNAKILYTSSDGEVVMPNATDVFGANIVSNTNENGKGVIIFDAPITSIGENAFYNCERLTSVTIPDGVTWIGHEAFYGCNSLTSVHITDLSAWCKIDFGDYYANPLYYAKKLYLNNSEVTNLTIPSDITEIKKYAFRDCSSLTSVTIGNSVTSIGERAFQYCSSLTSVTIGNSVNSIVNDAFAGCTSLTSVTIPDSVTEIGSAVFWKCSSLTSVTIGNGVTEIGAQAFQSCSSLTSVYCKPTNPPAGDQYMFDQNASGRKIYVPYNSVDAYKSAEYWSKYAFDIIGYDFETGEAVVIKPNNEIWYTSSDGNIVTPYATDVFGANIVSNTYEDGMGIIKFDAPITSIGEDAFYNCKRLTSITIPDGVTWIGANIFNSCSNLASVTIPNSITWIGSDAFSNCSSLSSVYISDIAAWCYIYFTSYKSNPLYYAHNLYLNYKLVTDLIIPDSVTMIEQYAFCYCSSLTSITIGNSVTEIGRAAFNGCKGKLIINSRRVVEGNYLKDGCPSSELGWLYGAMFTSVTIGNNITSIGEYVFYKCSSLKSVTIGDSVTSIGYSAFYDCSSLSSVYISDIAAWCNISFKMYGNPLYYAHNLYLNNELVTNLTIPDGVTKIGKSAFENCTLETITIPSSVTTIGASAFECCNMTSITIHDGVKTIGDRAFYYCYYLKSITIPNSVTTIGDRAFYSCDCLKSLTIPNSVTTIGNSAFEDCNYLKSVTIGNGIEMIYSDAFRECIRLENVYCKAVTPPSLESGAFAENYSSRYIYVPSASLSTYKNKAGWSNYKSSLRGYDF